MPNETTQSVADDPLAAKSLAEEATQSDHQLREVLARTTAAALAVSGAEPGRVFQDLALGLARVLNTDAALIAEFVDSAKVRMRTLALAFEGRLLRAVEYDVTQTPCRHVVGRASRFVAQGVNSEFAPGTLFSAQGFDAYAGYSILNGAGEQLGIIVALNRKPIANQQLTEALLKIFAVRAAAEMEQVRARAALAASEASYRAIFEANEDAIFVHDWATGAILDVSPKASDLWGYPREALCSMRVGEFSANVPPYTEADAVGHIERAKHSPGPLRFDWRSRHRDGHLMWHEVTLKRAEIAGQPRVLAFVRDVTESRGAEEALRSSEEQYRAIFNASVDAVILWDSNLRRVDINPAYQRIYGWKREEVVGHGFERPRFSEEYEKPRLDLVRRALAGESCFAELETFRRDGARILTEVHATPFRHRGEPHALVLSRDITERKRAEEALRASEEQYRAIFNASADSLQLLDARHRVVDVNRAYERMYGKRREEVIGKTLTELVPAAYQEERRVLVERALAGDAAELQTKGFRRDGTAFELEVRVIPFQHLGQPHVLGIARDITERKRVEKAVLDSEEQYRSIFNASADAMLLRDDSMTIVDANPAFLALCGLRREAVVGKAHAPFVIEGYEGLAEQLLSDALGGVRGSLEAQTRSRDGSLLDVEVRAMPMLYRGRPHVLAIARNITSEKRAEAERTRFEAQLRQAQKMEAIGQLTGGIAHDFNNILASVMGYVVLAEERLTEGGDTKTVDYLGQALGSCRRARDLIQQMLTFSRGGRGEPRALSLAAVVRDAMPMLRSALPSTLAIDVTSDDGAPAVWIDEVQVHQVLLNLAINARDAMPDGGTLRIAVKQSRISEGTCTSCRHPLHGHFVELRVADSGRGIEPALMERIFDPFFSTKAPGKGTGMGLSMVHGIVHEHRGHVLVESEPGQGCVFRVLLPSHHGAPKVASAPAQRRRWTPLAGRVLLVDDEPSVLAVMRETLASWGLDVEACASAEAAERLFLADPGRFDLLVTDHAMPLVTGIELAEKLLKQRPGLPWVLCTGYAEPAVVSRCDSLDVTAVLYKPIERDELRAALEAALSTH
jgi:PAS domain S-box-containing protein